MDAQGTYPLMTYQGTLTTGSEPALEVSEQSLPVGYSARLDTASQPGVVMLRFMRLVYAIDAQAQPAAGGSVACSLMSVEHGGASTCEATAEEGYRFSHWSGVCSGEEPVCTLSDIQADQAMAAHFEQTSGPAPTPVPLGGPWVLALMSALLGASAFSYRRQRR